MNGNDSSTVDRIRNLRPGSEIDITYETGNGEVTDTFRYQREHYALGDTEAWVNMTNNGWQNDFAPNRLTIESTLRGRKVTIRKER